MADWSEAEQALTAWANFQGPFTLHGVAAAALGLRGNKLRLLTPPDSGGSFGIKSSVLSYVVLLGLASRKLGVPVRWTEDRVEHLLGSAAATGRVTTVEAGFTSDGELVALRYDAIEDVGAYVRAPEPATLYRMHGSLSGAYRVRNVAARNRVVLTNTLPSGLNRGFGGPQLYFGLERTMAIAARPAGARPGGAGATQPRAGGGDALPHPVRRPVRLRRLRGLPRRRARARGLGGPPRGGTPARASEGRLVGVGLACVVEPSISNMGYITLAQTAVERAQTAPKSGNAEGALVIVSPLGGVTVRLGTTPQGQGHRTVVAQVVADELGVDAGGGRRCSRRWTRRPCRGRSHRATTRRASRESPSERYVRRRAGCAPRPTRSASTSASRSCRSGASQARRTGTPKGCPPAWSRGWRPSPTGRRRTSTRPTPRTGSRRRARTG